MKGSLGEQLTAALASGDLKIELSREKSMNKKRVKSREYVPPSNRSVMNQLLEFGKDENSPPGSIPPNYRNVRNFAAKVQKLKIDGAMTTTDLFFTVLGYAEWNKSAQYNDSFRLLFCDFCLDLLQVKISGKVYSSDWPTPLKNASKRADKFIDQKRFSDNALLCAIQHLKGYDFEAADCVVEAFKRDAPGSWLKADELDKQFQFLRTAALSSQLMERLSALLKNGEYREADELFRENDLLSHTEYDQLKIPFIAKDIMKVLDFSAPEKETESLADAVLKHYPKIIYDMSWERLRPIIVDRLESLPLPSAIYRLLINEAANRMNSLDESKLYFLLTKVLTQSLLSTTDYPYMWKILIDDPKLLKAVVSCKREQIDKMAGAFPFDRLNEIGMLYMPPELWCLKYLKNKEIHLGKESYKQLKFYFQKNRYFNCQMVLALLMVRNERRKITLKDIMDNLLTEIVKMAFDYNIELKTLIPNLIFPECISDYKSKNFQISKKYFVFCEGKRLKRKENGEIYMLCRNRQCDERTKYLNDEDGTKSDNHLFIFLEQIFGISSEEIFSEDNFVRAMGAFNRWNEISERLICGYNQTPGCGSSLIYNKSKQVKAGWAAYATTYWRCSNPTCKEAEIPIKLSHCKGCGKIIDSRMDKISCERRDHKQFFICLDCGFCCDEHKISGICPKCGKPTKWKSLGEYGKRYQCLDCRHEIAVPGKYKHSLDSDLSEDSEDSLESALRVSKNRVCQVSDHDDISFDDIPF